METKSSVLIIRSSENSTWGSCRVISPNLQAVYQLISSEINIDWFDIPMDYNVTDLEKCEFSILKLSEKIKSKKYDRIISVDHLPVQPQIFLDLIEAMPIEELPPIIFHIYGDFTYFANYWVEFGEKFQSHHVRYIVASNSQKKLLESFCRKSDDIQKMYFPVSEQEFSFSSDVRNQTRVAMGIDSNTTVFCYAGRISLQKNVDVLIKLLNKAALKTSGNIELWIIGAIDDQGAHFADIFTYNGYLFTKINLEVEKAKNIKIKFLGQKNKSELKKLMCAADGFISLSLYHDEDYGMSPAEALACGLPSLLTDWGGYSSFVSPENQWSCQLMGVKLSEYGHQLEKKAMNDFVEEIVSQRKSDTERTTYSNAFLSEFSIKNSPLRLKKLLEKEVGVFHGFLWKLRMISHRYGKRQSVSEVGVELMPSNDNLYYEIYKHYISRSEDKVEDR